MAVQNNTGAPRVAPTPAQTNAPASTSTERFADAAELKAYITDGPEALSAKYFLANITENTPNPEQQIKDSAWVKSFEKGVDERIAKLGANPTKEDVKKAVNAEMFEQRIGKFAVDRASSRIMGRIKELMADTFK